MNLSAGKKLAGASTLPNSGQEVANSPMPETRIMSSPNRSNWFSTRSRAMGKSVPWSIDRKNTRRRVVRRPSPCSLRNGAYMRNGSPEARVSAKKLSFMSPVPGSTNSPMSTLVVRPRLAE